MGKFEDYMSKEIPGYETLLDAEQLLPLKSTFADWENAWKEADYCLKHFNNTAGVDYTNDYEKAMKRTAIFGQKLQAAIDKLKEVYHIEKPEKVESERKSM